MLPTHPISDGELTLRPPAERDVPRMVEACQEPEIPRWTTVPSPYSTAPRARGRGDTARGDSSEADHVVYAWEASSAS